MSPARRRSVLRLWSLCGATACALVAWAADPAPATPSPTGAPAEAASTDPADLGQGLRYGRLRAADSSALLANVRGAPALVLDLRLAAATPANLATLRELLARADTARPLLLLVGDETPAPLREALAPHTPGVLTLAHRDAGVPADVLVATTAAADRAAAEALAAGRPARELIEEKLAKVRHDEASLARNHASGREEDFGDTAPPTPAAKSEPATAAPTPPQDVVLQRAVFIHRALLALDRIPAHS